MRVGSCLSVLSNPENNMSKKEFFLIKFLKFSLYFISRMLAYLFFILYNRFTYKGKKNVPSGNENGTIICSNHCSYIDPFIVGIAFHKKVRFLAKKSLFSGLMGWWVKNVGAIPIDREDTSPSTLKIIFNCLKQGHTLVIFPEGTRSRDGKIKPFKKGIGMIVKKSKAAVIPAYLKGVNKIKPKGKKFPRPVKLTAYYGKPVDFSDIIDQKGQEIYQEIADRIYNEIINLQKKSEK